MLRVQRILWLIERDQVVSLIRNISWWQSSITHGESHFFVLSTGHFERIEHNGGHCLYAQPSQALVGSC